MDLAEELGSTEKERKGRARQRWLEKQQIELEAQRAKKLIEEEDARKKKEADEKRRAERRAERKRKSDPKVIAAEKERLRCVLLPCSGSWSLAEAYL